MPRKKRRDAVNRRQWGRVHVPPKLAKIIAILAAHRGLPYTEAHQIIEQSLRDAYTDEYARAVAMLSQFADDDLDTE